ncbi:hypothetical protein IWZ00DRAFT_168699 [Phyllosticta capitalensis]
MSMTNTLLAFAFRLLCFSPFSTSSPVHPVHPPTYPIPIPPFIPPALHHSRHAYFSRLRPPARRARSNPNMILEGVEDRLTLPPRRRHEFMRAKTDLGCRRSSSVSTQRAFRAAQLGYSAPRISCHDG